VIRENESRGALNQVRRPRAHGVRKLATWGRLCTAVILSSVVVIARGAEGLRLESGLKAGEIANMFSVRAVTGPYRGKTLCYRCQLGNSPVVCIFARRITASLESMFKQLDARIACGNDDLKALVVFLAQDAKKSAASLETLAGRCSLDHIPLTMANNAHGPEDYRIADAAEVTILMWKGPTVRVNRAFRLGELSEAEVKNVLLDLAKVLKD
jgi:hypothetical protein